MNTETVEAAPANLTVAQLSQALKPKAPVAAPEPKKSVATAADPLTTREPSTALEGEGEEAKPTVLSQTALEADAETEVDSPTELIVDGQAESGEAEGDKPAKPGLPQELLDAIEIAKGDGKKGVSELLKRVNKLVDQRDTERNRRLTSEERITQMETELAEAKAAPPERETQTGSSTHPAVARLNQSLAEVNGFIQLFKANPDGVEIEDGKGGKTYLAAEAVADHLERLRDKRTELVAQRSVTQQRVADQHAETFRQIHQQASKVYPWLAQAEAPEQARLKVMLEALPGLKALPDHELIVARYLRGLAAEQAAANKANGSRKAPVEREPTQVVADTPSGKAGPADAKGKAAADLKAAEVQFKKTGSARDLQALETARLRLRRAA